MREKKYIDRLYQEKFKDFEATPREEVWQSIESRLREKQKKPAVITPFWSRMAGIAALLAILFLIGDWVMPVQNTPAVVNEDKLETELPNNSAIEPQIASETTIPDTTGSEILTEAGAPSTSIASASAEDNEINTVPSNFLRISSINNLNSNGILSGENLLVTAQPAEEEIEEQKESSKKSLFEEIEDQKEIVVAEVPKKNFEVSTHAAPIYYGNFGKGNFLDPRFNDNSSEGEITYSYGVNIAYALSDKIKLRSGVNKVNMSYNTSGVAHKTLAAVSSASGITIQVKPSLITGAARNPNSRDNFVPSTKRATAGSLSPGFMNQRMGFIEVPLELEYNLINKRIEFTIIGGASTLFLNENSISVDAEDFSGQGEAQNLNNISFSTNIGFGVDYKLSEKFKLNFEPMLKYQLNTFDENSSDSQPYYLGIYSGFSFKF